MLTQRASVILSLSVVGGLVAATSAQAGGFALREQSSYYQGMSFAGYGTTGPSISSMFWNPATITGAGEGFTFETHNTLIVPNAEITGTFTPGVVPVPASTVPSGDIGNDAYVPASYTAYKVTDQVFFGVAINAPFGLATKPGQNWAGQFYSRSSKAQSINVNPIIGYKINDMLSVAFGVQFQHFAVSLKTGIPTVAGFPSGILEGDDIGFGVTAGVTYKPFKGTEIGLGYRSGIAHTLGGSIQSPAGTNAINANLITPDMVNLSVKQRVTDAFRVFGTAEWTNWSRLKSPRVTLQANGATVQTLHFNYNDGWFFALGGEYDVTEDLTMRAGIGYVSEDRKDLSILPQRSVHENFALTRPDENPGVRQDFTVPVDGLEAPWGKAQIVFYHDTARLPDPPKSVPAMLDWAKANPGRLSYPLPPDFLDLIPVRRPSF